MSSWHPAVHTADFAVIIRRKELLTVPDVERTKATRFGESVGSTRVRATTKLSTVAFAQNSPVTSLSNSMTPNMDRRVPSPERDS